MRKRDLKKKTLERIAKLVEILMKMKLKIDRPKEIEETENDSDLYSDRYCADAFISLYEKDVRFIIEDGMFYIWDGHRWIP